MQTSGLADNPALHDARLASLIIDNAIEYAIFMVSFDGEIMNWSRGAERILGYTPDEAIGMHVSALFTPSDVSAGSVEAELDKARRTGRAEDSRWHVRKNGERFWANGATMLLDEPELSGLLKVMRDETASKLADEQRVLLLNELNHRIKNTLATVQSIAEQTLRASDADPATRHNLTARLIAISEAHNVLVEENWAGADLQTIVAMALAPHQQPGRQIVIDGPPVRLSPQQAVTMALRLHELATNALKYGALSQDHGSVRVTWNLSQDGRGARSMTLLWEESGGPVVEPPQRHGFGSRLMTGQEGAGNVRVEYLPGGVRCAIELPLSSADEIPMLDVKARH